jgi:glycerol-3-phosphate acyltransferase PlsX
MNNVAGHDMITISLDCLGGDNCPGAMVEGMIFFLKRHKKDNVKFLLFGDSRSLEKELKKYKNYSSFYEIIHNDKKISADEKPSVAIRKGRDSSMGLAIDSVKQKKSGACISAGNTGALMALSKLILRPLVNVDRPALVQLLPSRGNGNVVLLDMGANIDCSSENLYQFALMGSVFCSILTEKENPRIGLLNVGSEDLKGNDVVKHTAIKLKESILRDNFYGFVEGNDIFRNVVDVIVTDGFTGNITLKTIEGTTKFIVENIKTLFKRSLMSIIGCLFLTRSLKLFKKRINPENYNGAMFIGLNGVSVKSHGNANGLSFYHAIKNTVKLVQSNINERIITLLNDIDLDEEVDNNKDII